MRTAIVLTVVLAALAVGCNKPQQAQSTELTPANKPVDTLGPVPTPPPADVSTETPEESTPLVAAPQAAPAKETTSSEDTHSGNVYVVQKGDTFFSIARNTLGNQSRWKEIQQLNPTVDPKKLRIGQKLVLPAK